MGTQIGISAYRLCLKKKGARTKKGVPPWWVFKLGGQQDGYRIIQKYVEDRAKHLVTYGENKVLHVRDWKKSDPGRWIDGLLIRGEAGYVQELVNIETAETTYTKQKHEAALDRFYFRFQLEDARPFGVLLLQSTGQFGVKGCLDTDLGAFLDERDLKGKITQLVDAAALEAFADAGQLQDVILLNRGQTASSRQALQELSVADESLGEEGDKLALHVRRKGGWTKKTWQRLWGSFKAGDSPQQLVTGSSMSKIDDFRVTLRIGGRNQTFSLLNARDSPIRFDITDEVTLGPDGNPTLESLRAKAHDLYLNEVSGLL